MEGKPIPKTGPAALRQCAAPAAAQHPAAWLATHACVLAAHGPDGAAAWEGLPGCRPSALQPHLVFKQLVGLSREWQEMLYDSG